MVVKGERKDFLRGDKIRGVGAKRGGREKGGESHLHYKKSCTIELW